MKEQTKQFWDREVEMSAKQVIAEPDEQRILYAKFCNEMYRNTRGYSLDGIPNGHDEVFQLIVDNTESVQRLINNF